MDKRKDRELFFDIFETDIDPSTEILKPVDSCEYPHWKNIKAMSDLTANIQTYYTSTCSILLQPRAKGVASLLCKITRKLSGRTPFFEVYFRMLDKDDELLGTGKWHHAGRAEYQGKKGGPQPHATDMPKELFEHPPTIHQEGDSAAIGKVVS